MSSYDYISAGAKNLDNLDADGFYISPAFLDKMTLHVAKNFLKLPKIKARRGARPQPRATPHIRSRSAAR
jgi:hypothetical protein